MICIQKMYGFYGLNHQIIEKKKLRCYACDREDERRKIEQYCGRPETAINILVVFESGNVTETPPPWSWKRKKDTKRDNSLFGVETKEYINTG